MNKTESDDFAREAERSLQEAVAEAIEDHRRAGKPIVVARGGRPVRIDPRHVRTVREAQNEYGGEPAPKGDQESSKQSGDP